jgi:hypothetical protein
MVESIPENTPVESNIYIAGNFNNWNPSDPNFILQMNSDSIYEISLPAGIGVLKYKFTRGEWATVETDECGHDIVERNYHFNESDTIINTIESWKDKDPLNCPSLTIVVTEIPENTPVNEEISIAGNFNNWNPAGEQYKLRKDSSGKYSVTINKIANLNKLEYKFTRGNLISAESDEFGNEIPSRLSEFGKTDTIYAKVNNWEDLSLEKDNYIRIVIDHVPLNTPDNDHLYITGNFNNWFPRDRDYIMNKTDQGKYIIDLPRKNGLLEFKITRGDWSKQEMDAFGMTIENRKYRYDKIKEIHIQVESWADLKERKKLVFVIGHIPEGTPENESIYLTSNINGWYEADKNYRFSKNSNGQYYLNMEIEEKYFEYKITRGSWDTEAADKHGNALNNSKYRFKSEDTVYLNIVEWKDMPLKEKNIHFSITGLPDKTPQADNIYIAGSFNNWTPGSQKYKLKKTGSTYSISIPVNTRQISYKFNRGDWKSVEGGKFGEEIDNRVLQVEKTDTVYVVIKSWKDLYGKIRLW